MGDRLRSGVFQREDRRWAWRLVADNGQVIATDGAQGYEDRADAALIYDRILAALTAPTVAEFLDTVDPAEVQARVVAASTLRSMADNPAEIYLQVLADLATEAAS